MRTTASSERVVDDNALWNSDPASWAAWNDSLGEDQRRLDTVEFISLQKEKLDKDIEKLGKQIQKEYVGAWDQGKIDVWEEQISQLSKRSALLGTILNDYAEAARREELDNQEPRSIMELASAFFRSLKFSGRLDHTIDRNDVKRETGWGKTELGLFFQWWAPKGHGLSINALAESLCEFDGQYGFVPMDSNVEQKDTQAARNAIIELLRASSKPSDVYNFVVEENVQRKEDEREYFEAEAERRRLEEEKEAEAAANAQSAEIPVGTEGAASVVEAPEVAEEPVQAAEETTPAEAIIQGTDMAEEEILASAQDFINESGLPVNVAGMVVIGSRKYGTAREDSDLDILVEYEGDMKEDSVFNALNGEPMMINGIQVDFFPIRKEESGDTKSWLASHKNGSPEAREDEDLPLDTEQNEPASAQNETVAEIRSELAQAAGDKSEIVRARAKEWTDRTGVAVILIESEDEIKDKTVLNGVRQGATGWFLNGRVFAYVPNCAKADNPQAEVDKTFIHEVVSHKGLRELLGEENFNSLCDEVWESMGDADRKYYLDYVSYLDGSELDLRRAAADEHIAHLSERLNPDDIGKWDRIVAKVKEILAKMGLLHNITDDDLSALLVASYQNLQKMNAAARQAEMQKSKDENKASANTTKEEQDSWKDYYYYNDSGYIEHGAYREKDATIKKMNGNFFESREEAAKHSEIGEQLKKEKEAKKYQARRQKADEEYAEALEVQGYLNGVPKKPAKIDLYKYTDPKTNDLRPVLNGIYHDKGMQVATDSHILVARKAEYDKSLEGKSTLNGKVIQGKYPAWRELFKQKPVPEDIDFERLSAFLQAVKADERYSKSFKKGSLMIGIRLSNGEVTYFRPNLLEKFVDFARSIKGKAQSSSAGTVYGSSRLEARNGDEVALIMPVKSEGGGLPGYMRIVFPTVEEEAAAKIDSSLRFNKGNGEQQSGKEKGQANHRLANDVDNEILKKGFDDVTLRHLNDVVNEIAENPAEYARIPSGKSESGIQSYRGAIEASLVARAGYSSSSNDLQPSQFTKERLKQAKTQQSLLESWAKAKGVWRADADEFYSNSPDYSKLSTGKESSVYVDESGKSVIKVYDPSIVYDTPLDAIDGILIHNHYFAPYLNVVGAGKNKDGEFVLILSQPFVALKEFMSLDEKRDYIAKLVSDQADGGRFEEIGQKNGTAYKNEKYIIFDLHDGNIFKSDKDAVAVIDNNNFYNTKEAMMQGNYNLGDIFTPESSFRITSQQDAEYRQAYEAGDMVGAQKMVKVAAKKWGALLDEDGNPKILYHAGTFTTDGNFIPYNNTHFGTKEAALDRALQKVDDYYYYINVRPGTDGLFRWEPDLFFDIYDENDSKEGVEMVKLIDQQPGYKTEDEAKEAGRRALGTVIPEYARLIEGIRSGKIPSKNEMGLAVVPVFLKINNRERVDDMGNDWDQLNRVIDPHVDGVVYKNEYEAPGSDNYIAFNPNQVKSAEPFTFDDAGGLIPLSERFNERSNDIRFRKGRLVLNDDGIVDFVSTKDSYTGGQKEGSVIERQYRKEGQFSFVGKSKIESPSDVAYIFKQLEESAIENAFVALIKDGKAIVLHIGMGGIDSTTADMSAVLAGYLDYKPDEVYFVHNHPSGNVKASLADTKLLADDRSIFSNTTGMIINTTSGQFGLFDYSGTTETGSTKSDENTPDIEIPVLSFDKAVFNKDYDFGNAVMTSAADVASFISSQRLGERGKIGALLLNRGNIVVGNTMIIPSVISEENVGDVADDVLNAAVHSGATAVIIYGDTGLDSMTLLSGRIKENGGGVIGVMDIVRARGRHSYSVSQDEEVAVDMLNDGGNEGIENLAEKRAKLLNTTPIPVSPNQIVGQKGVPGERALDKALRWFATEIGKPLSYSTEIGDVIFDEQSIRSSLSHKFGQLKLDALLSIPEGFKSATYITTLDDFDGGRIKNSYFAFPIEYNGERMYVLCRTKKSDDVGSKRRIYIHEVFPEVTIKEHTLHSAAEKNRRVRGMLLYLNLMKEVLGKGTNSFGKSNIGKDKAHITSQQNAEYMDAVNSGDMEKAQRMVAEVAGQAGYKYYNGFYVRGEYGKVSSKDSDLWSYRLGKYMAVKYAGEDVDWYTELDEEFEGIPIDELVKTEGGRKFSNAAFFEAGFKGNELPQLVFARRIGLVPEFGASYNYRDQMFEKGVSVLGVYEKEGFKDTSNGTYELFNGGKKYLVEGLKINSPGSDGEPLLVRAKMVGDLGDIKSADPVTYDDEGNIIPLSQRFNAKSDDIRFRKANQNQMGFVSNAARAVEAVKMDKATPAQWKAMIAKEGGLKAGEDKWLGLSEWLDSSDKKTLTKDEVMDFVEQNAIQIEEERYGQLELDALQEEFDQIYDDIIDGVLTFDEDEEQLYQVVMSPAERAFEELNSRHHGGDDFDMAFELGANLQLEIADEDRAGYFLGVKPIYSTRLQYTTEYLNNKREIALTVPTVESWNESDEIHFGDADEGRAVAWSRFVDTKDKDWNSVLVIDEIQSNRHQEGRDKGYAEVGVKTARVEAHRNLLDFQNRLADKYNVNKNLGEYELRTKILSKANEEEQAELGELISTYNRLADNSGIPAAPFEKNWHELAFKRMIRLAAEEGYDKLAWTNGDMQAERYNIGGVVPFIDVRTDKDNDNFYRDMRFSANNDACRVAANRDGIITLSEGLGANVEGKSLGEVFGKDIAVRIMSARDYERIDLADTRVGGEGMKGFYDKMLPAFVDKYCKKWGVKTEDIELPGLQNEKGWHSIDITPEMKESVMSEGQVMFRKSKSEEREARDRYEKNYVTVAGMILGGTEEGKKYLKDKKYQRKAAATELYNRVLNNQFDDVTLRLINEYIDDATPKNPFGRRISQRLPQAMERGLYEGERNNAVDALFSRISEGAVEKNGRNSQEGRRRIAEKKKELLKGWAIASGNWHTSIADFVSDTERIGHGKDSDVYSSKNPQKVIKVSKGKNEEKKFSPDIDAVNLFNFVFPNMAYDIKGYGEIDGKFVKFLEQEAVRFDIPRKVSEQERVDYMAGLGFRPYNKENTLFTNDNLVVADLQKANIVKGEAGQIRVIDADVKLHTPDFGGKYTYPEYENDILSTQSEDESPKAEPAPIRFRKDMNQLSSKGLAESNKWNSRYFYPMVEAINHIISPTDMSLEDIERYTMLKHGLDSHQG